MSKELIESKVIAGDPIRIDRDQVVTLTRSIRAYPFGSRLGLIWNRPLAVMIIGEDGNERVVPIKDVTRTSVILLWAAGLVGTTLIWGILRARQSR